MGAMGESPKVANPVDIVASHVGTRNDRNDSQRHAWTSTAAIVSKKKVENGHTDAASFKKQNRGFINPRRSENIGVKVYTAEGLAAPRSTGVWGVCDVLSSKKSKLIARESDMTAGWVPALRLRAVLVQARGGGVLKVTLTRIRGRRLRR